jgi:recombination protein RecA
MCLKAISQEHKILYIDSENALNLDRVVTVGGNPKNIDVSTAYIVEEVADLVESNLSKYGLIIIDSIASLIPRAEESGDAGDVFIGLKARLMGQWMRRLIGKLGKSETAVVFINQLRETMEIYGLKKSTPGGYALPYAASLRLELSTTRGDRIASTKDGDAPFKGQTVRVEVTKSKICAPYQKTTFKLLY